MPNLDTDLLQLCCTLRDARNATGEEMPMMAGLLRNGRPPILVRGLDEGLTADERGAHLRRLIRRYRPYAVIILFEAWSAPGKPSGTPARDVPGAMECMVAIVETAQSRRSWVAEIKDSKAGEFIERQVHGETGPITGLLYHGAAEN